MDEKIAYCPDCNHMVAPLGDGNWLCPIDGVLEPDDIAWADSYSDVDDPCPECGEQLNEAGECHNLACAEYYLSDK